MKVVSAPASAVKEARIEFNQSLDNDSLVRGFRQSIPEGGDTRFTGQLASIPHLFALLNDTSHNCQIPLLRQLLNYAEREKGVFLRVKNAAIKLIGSGSENCREMDKGEMLNIIGRYVVEQVERGTSRRRLNSLKATLSALKGEEQKRSKNDPCFTPDQQNTLDYWIERLGEISSKKGSKA